MNLRRRINITIFFLVFALAAPFVWRGYAQERSAQEQKGAEQKKQDESLLRVETELVQIDIVVTDGKGAIIRDLKREDFELYEDGKKQSITHFAVGTATQPARWISAGNKNPTASKGGENAVFDSSIGRYVVLAVDDYHLAPENLIITKRTLHKFINEQLVPGDQVAVVATSGSIGLFQQFTTERAVLARAIDRLSVQNRAVVNNFDVPRLSEYQAELIDKGDIEALELAVQEILRFEQNPPAPPASGRGGGGRGPTADTGSSPEARARRTAQSKARQILAQSSIYSKATLSTLENVIRSLRQLTGRKVVVLLSDGFYLGGNTFSQTYDIRRITDAATRAGVVLYSIDARGLVATPPGGDASQPSGIDYSNPGARARIEQGAISARRDGMYALAYDTGGLAIYNNNDLNLGLKRILDDNEVYYVLAYEPPDSRRDGRFHKIDVKIADRPELKVRTRKGYFAPTEKEDKAKLAEKALESKKEKSPQKAAQEAKEAREAQIRAGLSSLFPIREIPVEMTADYMDSGKDGAAAILSAHISATTLNFKQSNGNYQNSVDLTVVIIDDRGKIVESYTDRIGLNIKPNQYEAAVKHGISYKKVVMLKPGFYQARVAVREEETGILGSAAGWIEIPDLSKKQLTVSSVILSEGEDNKAKQNEVDNGEGYGLRPSTARRIFKSGGKLDFYLVAYNAKLNNSETDLVVQSQVFAGSKLIYASPLAKMAVAQGGDLQRIPYAAQLSLEGFSPGAYDLRVVVVDRISKATTNRRVGFKVE